MQPSSARNPESPTITPQSYIRQTSSTMSAFVSIPLKAPASPHATLSPKRQSPSHINSYTRPKFSSTFTNSFTMPAYQTKTSMARSPFTMLLDKSRDTSTSPVVTDTRRRHLYKIITSSPVFQSAHLSVTSEDQSERGADATSTCLDDWVQMGSVLDKALGRQANDVRVYQYYLPIFFWILRELEIHNARLAEEALPSRPFILGFSCPQGGGKTTMTTFLETLLCATGKHVQIASLDDFYVTNKEQRNIAQTYPNNRLMQYRGMPGTHDLNLLNHTLDCLRKGADDVTIPRYDKTAFSGRGDRAPVDQWKHISDKTDVLLLEGWCIGFEPADKENLIYPDLEIVNDALKDFISVYKKMDGMLVIEISNMDWVYDWRLQAERGTRAAGRPGLTDEQVIDFVSRFMPAYKQYSSHLYNRPGPLLPNHELHIEVDRQRRPVQRNKDRPLEG